MDRYPRSSLGCTAFIAVESEGASVDGGPVGQTQAYMRWGRWESGRAGLPRLGLARRPWYVIISTGAAKRRAPHLRRVPRTSRHASREKFDVDDEGAACWALTYRRCVRCSLR